jgi:hypothetical protein
MSQAKTDDTKNIAAAIRKLSLADLQILADAPKSRAEGWLAIENQPRAKRSDVFETLSEEVEPCNIISDLVWTEAGRRRPKTIEETEAQAHILIAHALMGDEWEKIVQLALPMAFKHEAPTAGAAK